MFVVFHLRLLDTAGIRETEDIVERIGVERSRQVLKEADLILLVLNYADELTDEDENLFEAVKVWMLLSLSIKQIYRKKLIWNGFKN